MRSTHGRRQCASRRFKALTGILEAPLSRMEQVWFLARSLARTGPCVHSAGDLVPDIDPALRSCCRNGGATHHRGNRCGFSGRRSGPANRTVCGVANNERFVAKNQRFRKERADAIESALRTALDQTPVPAVTDVAAPGVQERYADHETLSRCLRRIETPAARSCRQPTLNMLLCTQSTQYGN